MTKTDHYADAITNLRLADRDYDSDDRAAGYVSAIAAAVLALVDATRTQTEAIGELTKAVREPVATRLDAP